MRKSIQVLIIAIAVYVILAGAFIYFLISPRMREMKSLEEELNGYLATIAEKPEVEAQLANAKSLQEQAEAKFAPYEAKMPPISFQDSRYAMYALLFEQREDLGPIIVDLIRRSGNEPLSVTVPPAPESPPRAAEPMQLPVGGGGSPQNITVSFRGTFHSTLEFLRRLEYAPRLLAVAGQINMQKSGSALTVDVPLREFAFAKAVSAAALAPAPAPGVGPWPEGMKGPGMKGPGMKGPGWKAGMMEEEMEEEEEEFEIRRPRFGRPGL